MLTIGILLFTSAAAASAIPSVAAPQPKLVASEYYGSSCPAADLNGLKITMGSFSALNATTDVAPLDFTLSKGNPNLGDFFGDGATLRMCDVLANVTVDPGWKVVVNAQGTQAQGFATLNGTLGIRATYQFTDKFENQSIGEIHLNGAITGQFSKKLEHADSDKGVVSPCGGGQIAIEFMSMTVIGSSQMPAKPATNESAWTFSTDIAVIPC